MFDLFDWQNGFSYTFLQEYSANKIVNVTTYSSITLGSFYYIFQQQHQKSKPLYIILSLSLLSIFLILILETNFLPIESYLVANLDSKTKLFIGLALCSAILTIAISQKWSLKTLFKSILLKDPEQCNLEIEAKIAAENKLAKLEKELEQKVLARTAALGMANHDLRESANLMEKVANLTPNILYIYDLEQQCNIYSNRFIGEVLGYSESEIEQKNVQLFSKLLHPEDRDLIAKHHRNCLNLISDDYLEIEYRMCDSKGNWRWLQSKDTVFERNDAGRPTQILGITQDITETKAIQSESARLNIELAEKVEALEQWHQERIKLARMNEFLQACLTIREAETALTDLLQPLFPNTHGAVYLMNNSKNMLDAIAAWGIPNSASSFEPQECWALRQGNHHQAHFHTPGLYCAHVDSRSHSTSTFCLPMIAKGKTLGMLYLRFTSNEPISELIQETAETVAQNIAMSFANLELQEKLRYQSLRDPLTGLYNRRYLQESLSKEIERARRKQNLIGIIMIDIDHFKRFNDVYGHSTGDLVLKEVGTYLLTQIRQYDVACRYGGEELVIVMPDASIENTVIRAEEIRNGIKKLQLEDNGRQLEAITVSIGVSCFPDDGTNTEELIKIADKALYRAKEQGRDRVERC